MSFLLLKNANSFSISNRFRLFSRSKFTHITDDGKNNPTMVDVADKTPTTRTAVAQTIVVLPKTVMEKLYDGQRNELIGAKGPIFTTSIIAGVMGAKRTSELIPFCHPLPLENCRVEITPDSKDTNKLKVLCHVKTTHKTGVEMEALTGSSTAALCIYDMCKALSNEIIIQETCLLEKTGGKQDYRKEEKQ